MDLMTVNEATMEALAKKMMTAHQNLLSVEASLRGIQTDENGIGDVRVDLSGGRLVFGRDLGGSGSVASHLDAIYQSLLGEHMTAEFLGKRIQQITGMLSDCEKAICDILNNNEGLMTKEQRIAADVAKAQIDAMIAIMKNTRRPEDLISVMKRENFHWWQQLATGVWSFISGGWHDIGEQQKERYLFKNALRWSQTAEVTIIDPTKTLEEWIGDYLSTIDGGTEILSAFANLSGAEMLKELKKTGKAGVDDLITNIHVLDQLEDISDIVGNIGDTMDAGKRVIEVYNELQILNSVDKSSMIETARVYLESGDSQMQAVGEKLMKLANANDHERAIMIVGGELVDLGFEKGYAALYDAGKDLATKNPIGATVIITSTAIDMLTGVNDVPGLQNELGFSTAAAQSTYEVLQNDLAAYEANPTDANLQKCVNSYTTYQKQVATAEEAAASLFQVGDDSKLPWDHLNSEQRAQMEQCRSSAASARTAAENMSKLNSNYHTASGAAKSDGDLSGLLSL